MRKLHRLLFASGAGLFFAFLLSLSGPAKAHAYIGFVPGGGYWGQTVAYQQIYHAGYVNGYMDGFTVGQGIYPVSQPLVQNYLPASAGLVNPGYGVGTQMPVYTQPTIQTSYQPGCQMSNAIQPVGQTYGTTSQYQPSAYNQTMNQQYQTPNNVQANAATDNSAPQAQATGTDQSNTQENETVQATSVGQTTAQVQNMTPQYPLTSTAAPVAAPVAATVAPVYPIYQPLPVAVYAPVYHPWAFGHRHCFGWCNPFRPYPLVAIHSYPAYVPPFTLPIDTPVVVIASRPFYSFY